MAEFSEATRQYANAVQSQAKASAGAEYEMLKAISDKSSLESELARQAFEEHRRSHTAALEAAG